MPTEPFAPADPLCYEELTREQVAWRTTLHLLAATAAAVHIPPGIPVDHTAIAIAAGWTYQPAITTTPDGGTVLECTTVNSHHLLRDATAGQPGSSGQARTLAWVKGRGPSVPPGGWPPGGTETEGWYNCAGCGDTIYPSEHIYPAGPTAESSVVERVHCAVCHVKARTARTGAGESTAGRPRQGC